MQTRPLGPFQSSAIGFGCMSLSHAYGTPSAPAEAAAVLFEALERGYTYLDIALVAFSPLVNPSTVSGARCNAMGQAEIGTEEVANGDS